MWRARFAAPISIAVRVARVVLERLDRRDDHDGVGPKLSRAADDMEELLHAHVGAEAALGDDVVAELQRNAVGDERAVAVRDVRERAAMDERRLSLQCLDEVRLDRLLQEDGHRPGRLQLLRGDRVPVEVLRDGDRTEACAEVLEVGCNRDDRHHFGRGSDVEARLPDVTVRTAAETDGHVAQRTVIDVEAAPPADRERVDAELVAVEDVRLEESGEQVVRGADRMDVACEVEVHVLHRDDLRVTAAGCAALDPEHGTE
jgi:hypothetical protein